MSEDIRQEVMKTSASGNYFIVKIDDRFYIGDVSGHALRTPRGEFVNTMYYSLAERILEDIDKYGPQNLSAQSILPWHYTLCENFIKMDHKEIEDMLDSCFMQKPDWTYDFSEEETWNCIFGNQSDRVLEIREWLSNCTHMQMTAACCIGNAYHSINIAFVLALIMENYTGKERKKKFKLLANLVANNPMYGPASDLIIEFNNFDLYYGIHLDQDGAIINKEFSILQEESDSDDIYVDEEMLVGRNFYHYTDGECDIEQPFTLDTDLSDLESFDDREEDEEDEEDENEDDENENGDSYSEYLPSDCWIKKISAFEDDDEEIYYHIVLEVKSGAANISVIKDEAQRGGGGMFFFPGMSMPASHYYEEVDEDDYPEAVENEIELLKKKRYLPNKFSFIGKKLPQKILDEGGNGGDMTDHTYAIQSAYRLAYTHMSVTTTEEGIIEDFDYSSYQSTGSGYGDMFTRPSCINDRHEEIIDMLLYILDHYTDEEFERIMSADNV